MNDLTGIDRLGSWSIDWKGSVTAPVMRRGASPAELADDSPAVLADDSPAVLADDSPAVVGGRAGEIMACVAGAARLTICLGEVPRTTPALEGRGASEAVLAPDCPVGAALRAPG